MTRTIKRWLLVAALVSIPALVLADEGEGEALGEEEAAEHHEHHPGDPVHLEHITSSAEFWTSVVNFTLLVIVLVRFGKAPIGGFLQKRRDDMERTINEAAEMKAAAEAKFKEYNDRLGQLDAEMEKLRKDLIASAEDDKKRIVAEAEESARRLKMETEALIDQHAKALSSRVRHEIVDGAIAAAERLLRERITPDDQQRIADGYRQEVAQNARKLEGRS